MNAAASEATSAYRQLQEAQRQVGSMRTAVADALAAIRRGDIDHRRDLAAIRTAIESQRLLRAAVADAATEAVRLRALGLPRPFEQAVRDQRRLREAVEQALRSLSASSAAPMFAAVVAGAAPPLAWQPVLAEMRRSVAALSAAAADAPPQHGAGAPAEATLGAAAALEIVAREAARNADPTADEETTAALADGVVSTTVAAVAEVPTGAVVDAGRSEAHLFDLLARLWPLIVARAQAEPATFGGGAGRPPADNILIRVYLPVVGVILTALGIAIQAWQHAADAPEERARHAEVMAAEHRGARAAERHAAAAEREHAEHTRRYRTRTTKPLWEEKGSGRRTALPAGQEFIERRRDGRWLEVELVDGAAAWPRTGCLSAQQIDLLPMAQDAGRAAP